MDFIMLLEEAEVKLNAIDKDSAPIPGRNKGGRGLWVEEQLGMPQSSQLNDFDDGELKAFKEGQTIAVTMLQHCLDEIFDRGVSYSESNVGKKLKNVLFVKFAKSGKFVKSLVSNADKYKQLYYDLSTDYNYICEKIRERYNNNQELNTINGPNKLLQIRTKANKNRLGKYVPLEYNGKRLKDKAMAFYLTRTFETSLF
jgi:DNA mismatch repair protein MutH